MAYNGGDSVFAGIHMESIMNIQLVVKSKIINIDIDGHGHIKGVGEIKCLETMLFQEREKGNVKNEQTKVKHVLFQIQINIL